MANQTLRWAFAQNLPRSEKLLLLALADFAQWPGSYCWPSQETAAAKASVSVDTCQRAMKALEHKQIIRRFRCYQHGGWRTSDLIVLLADDASREMARRFEAGESDALHKLPSGRFLSAWGPPCRAAHGEPIEIQSRNAPDANTALLRPPEPSIEPLSPPLIPPTAYAYFDEASADKRPHDRNLLDPTDWPPLRQVLRGFLSEGEFASWFAAIESAEVEGRTLRLEAPTRFIADEIARRFECQLRSACKAIGKPVDHVRATVRSKASRKAGGIASGAAGASVGGGAHAE